MSDVYLLAGPMSKDGRFAIKIHKAVPTTKELLAIRAQLDLLIDWWMEQDAMAHEPAEIATLEHPADPGSPHE